MQKALAEMRSYKGSLKLPGMKMQPLSVFQRIKLLLKELKTLEKITREQNELLEVKKTYKHTQNSSTDIRITYGH